MRRHDCAIRLMSEGDAETGYASGPLYYEDRARWDSEADISEGDVDSGAATITLPLETAVDRRRCFALETPAGFTVARLNTDFGFAGGSPTAEIDLDDYPWVGSTTTVAAIVVSELWVTTDRILAPVLTLSAGQLGRWMFIEGELLADWRVWDPPGTSTAL